MLNKRQKEVARELYEGRLREEDILEQYELSPKILQKWLAMEEFQQELDELRESSRRQTQFTIARYAPVAALRLAELVGSEKPDVARRAALDLIDRCLKLLVAEKPADESEEETETISDEQARKMLRSLAEGVKDE